MCLAVPGRILDIEGADLERVARVSFGGVVKRVSLAYLPDAETGEFVVVHAGFALSRLDQDEARRVFDCLDEMERMTGSGA